MTEKTYPMECTANEAKLIAVMKSLKPFEQITISADKGGAVGSFVVVRSYKEEWGCVDKVEMV